MMACIFMSCSQSTLNQTALFYAPLDVRIEDVPLPELANGELLVQVGKALTCGTDLKCYKRGHPVLLGDVLPAPFGHEFSGTIVAIGGEPNRTQWQVGQRVVCANSAPCFNCYYCQQGQHNLCEQLVLLNGAYAQFIKVPANIAQYNTYLLPAAMPFEIAAFTEPLAVALRGVEAIGVTAGQSVAIVGLGPIGQLMVKVATLLGATVTAIARSPHKLTMAEQFGGAVQTVSIAEGFNPQVIKQVYSPEGRGFDVVIEAVGLPETWEKSVHLARKGGKIHWFAGCKGGSTISLETKLVHYNELTLYSLFHHTPEYVAKAFNWLATGKLDPTPLLSGEFALADVVTALQAMEQGKGFKYAITPPCCDGE
jgi:L-iditol 2-dehydrogenase